MKTFILSTTLAAGLGAFAIIPASAAGLSVRAPVVAEPATTNVDCRTIERRVQRDGVTKITRERQCDGDRDRRVYRDDDRRSVDRRDYRGDRRFDDRPGINLRLGN